MATKKGLYATEPVAKAKAVADRNPVGTVTVTGRTSPTVPTKGGKTTGLGPVGEPFGQHHIPGAHGYGHPPRQHHGKLRLSGYTNAHRLGAPSLKVPKPKR